jgi:hypothetical protein
LGKAKTPQQIIAKMILLLKKKNQARFPESYIKQIPDKLKVLMHEYLSS